MLENENKPKVIYTGKAGRPLGSGALGIYASDRRAYNRAYVKKERYVFSVNLDKEKDSELIKILETYKGGNRQGAVKELCLAGYKALTSAQESVNSVNSIKTELN